MPARRQHRDQIADQEEVVEFEHLLQDEEPDRQIIARRQPGFLDSARASPARRPWNDPWAGRSGFRLQRCPERRLARRAKHRPFLSPDARLPPSCAAVRSAETIRDKISTRPLIAIILNCHQFDRKSASPKMDLRQFRYFIQVARRENFRKASDDLRVAQSALTRQIQQLEQRTGVSAVRSRQARRAADRGGPAPAGTLAAYSGRSRPAEGEPADRGACAERPGIAGGAAVDRAAAVPQARADLSEIISEGAASACSRAGPRTCSVSSGAANLVSPSSPIRRPIPLLEYTQLFTESLYLVGRPDDPRLKKRSLEVSSLGDLPLVMTSKHNRSRQLIESSAAQRRRADSTFASNWKARKPCGNCC